MKLRIPALLAAAALLAACSSPAAAPSVPAASRAASATPAAVAPAAATTLTAVRVARALKARGLPVTRITVVTAADDSSHLLGHPGEYTSKTTFADSRITGQAGQEVAAGGSVEVFTTHAAAVRRAGYIQATAVPGAEYDYIAGRVLLRISGQLTPAQARRYSRALAAITGKAVTVPGKRAASQHRTRARPA